MLIKSIVANLNLYTYVNNNPLGYTDPTGHMPFFPASTYVCMVSPEDCQNQIEVEKAISKVFIDDITTLLDEDASLIDKILAGAGFIPFGKYISIGGKLVVRLSNGEKYIEKAVDISETALKYTKNLDCNCFTAGTKVLTEEGETDIEEIEVGDKVLSKSDITGEVGYKEVVGLFHKKATEIYYIHIGQEKVEVTAEHPFWLDGKGWTLVKDLNVGDLLVTSSGKKLPIDSIQKEARDTIVYNFEVADYNSYFVSNLGIWVHNCSLITPGKNFKDHFIRHKKLLEELLGTSYPKYKTHGAEFLLDIGKIIDDGTVTFVGQGTLKKGGDVLNIYRGSGITVAIKPDGEFVTLLKSGEGLDTAIQFIGK